MSQDTLPAPRRNVSSSSPAPAPPLSRIDALKRRLHLPWRPKTLAGRSALVLIPLALTVLAGCIVGILVAAAIHMPQVDSVSSFQPGLITEVHDVSGETFASFSRERRILLDETEVPQLLIDALLSSEDQSFFEHGGVDLWAIPRAQLANLRAGSREEGASTLTMQLARELFLTREKTWRRKIEEAFLAVELEKRFTKPQILTLYMNLVNVGNGNYGMAAAARDYFDKEVGELSLPEAATLIGVLPAPSRYNPYRRPDLVLERRNTVLRRMRQAGHISEEEEKAAQAEPLTLSRKRRTRALAPYFAEEIRQYLESTYGTSQLIEGGLQVESTLDPAIQLSAEAALRRGLLALDHGKGWRGPIEKLKDVDLETHTLPGWVGEAPQPGLWYRGIVLSSDRSQAQVKIENQVYTLPPEGIEWTETRNVGRRLSAGDVAWFRLEDPAAAAEGGGQAESTASGEKADQLPPDPARFNIFLEQEPELEGAVLVLESATGAIRAMVGGWDFERSKFNRAVQALRQVGSAFKPFVYGAAFEEGYTPADTLFDGPTLFPGGADREGYQPRNNSRTYHGIVTLRRSLESSINVTAVKLLTMVGIDKVIDFARLSGVKVELPPYPSLALGTAEMTPLELASAYATIANQGTYVEPYMVERILTPRGETLEQHHPSTRLAMDPRVAYVLTHTMEGVVDRGSGHSLRTFDLDLAGKTGTTDRYSDAWFVGFTPRYTLLVWVGYDLKRSIGRNMTGTRAALPIWQDLLDEGLDRGWVEVAQRFPIPAGVTLRAVEYQTGLLPGPEAQMVIEEAFLDGTEPVQVYTPRWRDILELAWYQQQLFYIPKEGERMPERWYESPPDEQLAEGQTLASPTSPGAGRP